MRPNAEITGNSILDWIRTRNDGAFMSAHEDKAKEVTEDPGHTPAGPESTESAKASDDGGASGIIILSFILGLAASLAVGWIIFPKLLYSEKKQPIDFNHAMHVAEVDDSCNSCHYFREDGSFSGVPKLEACTGCHEEILGESEEEEKFFNEYVSAQREVPWLIYSKQPDCVFFSHAAHVLMGEMKCVTCHGHIGESETPRLYEANRITGYSRDIWGRNMAGLKQNSWDRMKMDDCAECHKRENVSQTSVQTNREGCFVCHK